MTETCAKRPTRIVVLGSKNVGKTGIIMFIHIQFERIVHRFS